MFQALADGLTEVERAALDALLTVDPELRRSRFAWLRDYSESPAPSNILELLNRLEYVRGPKIGTERAGRIHAARLGRLVDEGAIMTVQHIVDLEPARRTAILVAQVADLEARLADATRDGTRVLPKRPPASFLPTKWRKLIFANGPADRHLYETAVLAVLRDRLKGSDIWVVGSRDYRAFETYLLRRLPTPELTAKPTPIATSPLALPPCTNA